jgi:hypothetical protein
VGVFSLAREIALGLARGFRSGPARFSQPAPVDCSNQKFKAKSEMEWCAGGKAQQWYLSKVSTGTRQGSTLNAMALELFSGSLSKRVELNIREYQQFYGVIPAPAFASIDYRAHADQGTPYLAWREKVGCRVGGLSAHELYYRGLRPLQNDLPEEAILECEQSERNHLHSFEAFHGLHRAHERKQNNRGNAQRLQKVRPGEGGLQVEKISRSDSQQNAEEHYDDHHRRRVSGTERDVSEDRVCDKRIDDQQRDESEQLPNEWLPSPCPE